MPLPPVLFEDDVVIAFDKPSGLLIAPDRWDKSRENLMDLVHDRMGHDVANVHRIDADTSGLVLVWKQLQQGSFRWPPIMDGVVKLSPVEFAALFDGIDWTRVQTIKGILKPTVAA